MVQTTDYYFDTYMRVEEYMFKIFCFWNIQLHTFGDQFV